MAGLGRRRAQAFIHPAAAWSFTNNKTVHRPRFLWKRQPTARPAPHPTRMLTGEFDLGSWRRHAQHPHELGAATLDWIFVMDSLNFCFWAADGTPPFTVEGADGRAYTGYWSLCAALNRALAVSAAGCSPRHASSDLNPPPPVPVSRQQEGIPITTPSFYATVPEETLQRVFRSATATEIPLFAERLAILHDNGRVLIEVLLVLRKHQLARLRLDVITVSS